MSRSPRTAPMPRIVPVRCAAVALALCLGGGAAARAQSVAAPPDSSGPQTAVPAPRPLDTPADVPGGSARNGVVRPPAIGGSTPIIVPPMQGNMPVIAPPAASNTPVIVPPGAGAVPGQVAK